MNETTVCRILEVKMLSSQKVESPCSMISSNNCREVRPIASIRAVYCDRPGRNGKVTSSTVVDSRRVQIIVPSPRRLSKSSSFHADADKLPRLSSPFAAQPDAGVHASIDPARARDWYTSRTATTDCYCHFFEKMTTIKRIIMCVGRPQG